MGGNQTENGQSQTHLTPRNLEDTLGKVASTSKVKEHPDPNSQRGGCAIPPSTSYFSTLEVPQSFSFEQKFQRSNAMILSDVQSLSSLDRSLSSPLGGNNIQGSPRHINFVSNPQGINPDLQSRETVRERAFTKGEHSRRDGSLRSLHSQKRQKYLEKRRYSSPCWPRERRKRSSHSDEEDEGISLQPVRKVFVNEEKMAARFDGLSLSHEQGGSPTWTFSSRDAEAQRVMADIDSRLMDSDDDDEDEVLSKSKFSVGQRLQMSDHLRTVLKQSKTEVLPEKIVKKIANPCTAMILWQPPDLTLSKKSEIALESEMAEEDATIERPILDANLPSSLCESNSDSVEECMEL